MIDAQVESHARRNVSATGTADVQNHDDNFRILDSGADMHIRNKMPPGSVKILDRDPIKVETVAGLIEGNQVCTVNLGDLGKGEAYLLPSSPNIDSLGKHIRDKRLCFIWSHSQFDHPIILYEESASDVIQEFLNEVKELSVSTIHVDGNIPTIGPSNPYRSQAMKSLLSKAKLSRPRNPTCPTSTTKNLEDNENEDVAVRVKPVTEHNTLTHMPPDPNCEVCRETRIQKKQARRKQYVDNGADVTGKTMTSRAQEFNDRKSMDILDPGARDVSSNRYLLTVGDEHSGWVEVYALKDKTAQSAAEEIITDARSTGEFARQYMSDNGGEFMECFDEELRRRLIPCSKSWPNRSTTNSRHERIHRTLNGGARAALAQSGFPYSFYTRAGQHFLHHFNRITKTRSDNKTAYQRRYGTAFTDVKDLHPFGCLATYFVEPEERRKFDASGRKGILLGYIEGGYQILPMEDLVNAVTRDKGGTLRCKHIKDVIFSDDIFPFKEFAKEEDATFDAIPLFIPNKWQECHQCGRLKSDELITCRACKGVNRRRTPHRYDDGCKLTRCRCDANDDAAEDDATKELLQDIIPVKSTSRQVALQFAPQPAHYVLEDDDDDVDDRDQPDVRMGYHMDNFREDQNEDVDSDNEPADVQEGHPPPLDPQDHVQADQPADQADPPPPPQPLVFDNVGDLVHHFTGDDDDDADMSDHDHGELQQGPQEQPAQEPDDDDDDEDPGQEGGLPANFQNLPKAVQELILGGGKLIFNNRYQIR